MEFKELELPGLVEITPRVFHDSRGFFFESFRQDLFDAAGITGPWVQDNQSFSPKGVLRGLHFQNPPYDQGKLVRVVHGRVLDVVVDIRRGSPTYGQHAKVLLEAERGNMLWVPPGFAHGFVALTDAVFSYKCTNYYHKASEGGLHYADPALGIDWQESHPLVSDKDLQLPPLSDHTGQFTYI